MNQPDTQPPSDAGSPDTLVRVAISEDDLSARLLAGLLEARDVPARVFGDFAAPVLGPSASPATIFVRRMDHALATEILTQLAYGGDATINHCHHCDYPLDDLGDNDHCPECGEPADLRAFDKQGHCVACRYDLMGLPETSACPECGLDLRLMGQARTRFTLVPEPGRPPIFVSLIAAMGWIALGVIVCLILFAIALVVRSIWP